MNLLSFAKGPHYSDYCLSLSKDSVSQFHKKNLTLESGTNLDSAMGPITPEHAIDYKNDFSNNLGCLQSQNELECLQVRHFKKYILEGIQQVCGPNFAHFHKIFHRFCRISIFFKML